MLNIVTYIEIIIFDLPLLLKGLHTDSLNISEIFLDLKIGNVVFEQIQKNTRHKTSKHFGAQLYIQSILK